MIRPDEYEKIVAEHYKNMGYKVKRAPDSNDYGVDVFAQKGDEKIAVQAKMYGDTTRRINRSMVMELYGAAAYFDCNRAVIATDGHLLDNAQVVANKLCVEDVKIPAYGYFNPIRKMYEVIIGELHEQTYTVNKEQNIVPKELFAYNNVLNITGSCYYLSGEEYRLGENVILPKRFEPVWPKHISGMARMLIQTTHLISHDYPEHVGHYTYKSTVYALLDLIIWYRDFITKYKAGNTI